jgi:carboxymethylenebutenolidase
MRNKRCIVSAVLVLAILASPAMAQVKTHTVTFQSGDEKIKGFLAVPSGEGPFPAVVVIQEWWGLNDWIKENAKRLAAKGYVALAPDLYRGKVTDNPKVASQLVKGLPPDRAVRDLKGAVTYLASRKDVKKEHIGSIGWCMGGGYSLQLAMKDDRVQACVMCYGRVVTDPEELKTFKTKLLGIFGEEDKGIPVKGVRAFEKGLKENGMAAVHIFKGAGHGFMREKNGDRENPAYREVQAREAWQEIEAFFAKSLK